MKQESKVKNLLIGFALGIGLAVCMGQAVAPREGTYQISSGGADSVFILDTRSGQIWQRTDSDITDFGTPNKPKSEEKNVIKTQ
ncbi:hypothetical protein L21SP3_01033 [Sedimentisphaera cyanobacteriorum]|uniref:Uncharacterized protein n=1 Tax=Sedimentisphaera cyanobacteriorum TaxID=1940790 RepID=A0A1Q2HPH0_9BACT|nr:hypothetical protein [Sedimentisphaera cyanobacteriorum]AQQ09231.1 hypothetical protein L21SP3_01033 [Sedimentisphaera cyanobacteriorum]